MNHYFLTSVLAFTVASSGCTSIARNGGGVEMVNIDHPPIGVVSVAYVGDEMLSKGVKKSVNAIELDDPVSVGLIGTYTFSPGIYTQIGHSEGKVFYKPVESGMIHKNPIADPYGGMYANHEARKICGVSTLGGTVCNEADYKIMKYTTTGMASFQQTLLYSGKVGSKINISYREFSNNQARSAFTNDVEYDLGESRLIGYKGAHLEIIDANNNSIKYKVLRNFR